MTIRNRYGKSLAAQKQEIRNRSRRMDRIVDNVSRLLNLLSSLVEVDVREGEGNRINLYLYGDAANSERAAATARIEKTLKCKFDKGVAEVKFSRITATVKLGVKRKRKVRRKVA